MKLTPTAAVVPLVLVLLTWLLIRGMNSDAQRFDQALTALDRFAMLEGAFQRDILIARSGMLRNYDPLVRETDALNDALDRLRTTAVVDPAAAAALDRLSQSIDRQEEMIEQFKSDNALLQNALAYFGLFSNRLGDTRDGPLEPAVSALAVAMLHLTLDTSPEAAREVAARLDQLDAQAPGAQDKEAVEALLAHGRLLQKLLPTTDGVLKALFAIPTKQEQHTIRTLVLARQNASRMTGEHFRLLLYATSLLLLGLLVHFGLQLRARSLMMRRRAEFEHVIAGISTRFINAGTEDIGHHIELALAQFAEWVGADRAYFVRAGPMSQQYLWSRAGVDFPAGWPDRISMPASELERTADGLVHVPSVDRLADGPAKDALAAAGLTGWVCVTGPGESGGALGFDALQSGPITRSDGLSLLRMAFDAVANAVGRERLEQERVGLERRLQQARRMEMVGALASGVAHNFNNIVCAILGYVEMTEALALPGTRIASNLDEIRRAGERARDLVDQVLTFGRRREARRSQVGVDALIGEAASLLRASLPALINLSVRQAPEVAVVLGETTQLQQVILNLCNNAAQAMDGAGHIEVVVELKDIGDASWTRQGELMPGRYAVISVTDTGCGMEPAVLERIFEPFFTTRRAGNGLGLATVREIVREHGGAVRARSTPGAGSRFDVWLPCASPGAAAERVPERAAPMLSLGQGQTVLMIDEERARLLRDEEMLAALGYEPIGFTHAAEALGACRERPNRFDAILIGQLAPDEAPLDLAVELRKAAPTLPILLATSSTDDISALTLTEAGISEVIHRPLVSTETASALARVLAAGNVQRKILVELLS